MAAYRSFAAQTRHYFDRPGDGMPSAPLEGASVWRGRDLRHQQNLWLFDLTAEHQQELIAAVRRCRSRGLTIAEVNQDNFLLPDLAAEIARWRDRIETGPGFVVVRGMPVSVLSADDASLAFWGIGHHLGVPGAQNPDQELLGHVRDYAEDDPAVRLYRTPHNIDFHCDAADVVGLLCLQAARSGGNSRIVSSGLLFNDCLAADPEAAARGFAPFRLDGRGESRAGAKPYSQVTPCCYADGRLRTFYHSEYFRSVARHENVVLDDLELKWLDLYDRIAADPDNYLEMSLDAGDMQFLSNHTIAHARTAYQDDPDRPRHLLRLWLSLGEAPATAAR